MSDMRSGPSLWTNLVLLIQSGILPYFPNCLPLASKANSTHGLLTSSALVAKVWLFPESFHLLSLSRLECPKAVFRVQSYSWSSLMISLTLLKMFLICFLLTLPSAVTSLILHTGKLQPLQSLQIMRKSQAGQTLDSGLTCVVQCWANTLDVLAYFIGIFLKILTILTLSPSLSERTVRQSNPLPWSTFLINHLEEVWSFKLLGLTLSHDLSWENHISKLGCKASCRLGILRRRKSFLPQLNGVMLSPLTGSPAADLAHLDTGDPKAFKVIGISHDEAVSGSITKPSHTGHWSLFLSLSLLPCPLWSCTLCSFRALSLKDSAGQTRSIKPPTPFWLNYPHSRITAHHHSFVPLFSHLENQLPHYLQSSHHVFRTAVHHHLRSSPIQNHDLFYPL